MASGPSHTTLAKCHRAACPATAATAAAKSRGPFGRGTSPAPNGTSNAKRGRWPRLEVELDGAWFFICFHGSGAGHTKWGTSKLREGGICRGEPPSSQTAPKVRLIPKQVVDGTLYFAKTRLCSSFFLNGHNGICIAATWGGV